MVTVKVTYDGTTRRVKMPLREMVPRVLEEHVRHRLAITAYPLIHHNPVAGIKLCVKWLLDAFDLRY